MFNCIVFSSNNNFYLFDRVSENILSIDENKVKCILDEFPILELKKLLALYKNFKQNNCSKCWASKLCSLCFRDLIDRDGTVNLVRSKKICINEKETLKKLLKEYCTVLKESPTLLDHLDDYIIYL